MARLPRLALPGYPHHVIQRGNNRQAIFGSSDDRFRMLALLDLSGKAFPFKLTLLGAAADSWAGFSASDRPAPTLYDEVPTIVQRPPLIVLQFFFHQSFFCIFESVPAGHAF